MSASVDPRIERARPEKAEFLGLAAQLVMVCIVAWELRLGESYADFPLAGGALMRIGERLERLLLVVAAGFGVHYWLPLRWKRPFEIALSIGGAFVLLPYQVVVPLVGFGLLVLAICSLPVRYGVRLTLVLALAGAAAFARWRELPPLAPALWPVLGSLFMFRLIVYLYDLRHMKERPRVDEFLAYFYLLPNYVFLLFPVVDFQTLRRSWYQRDGGETAQKGILWIARGFGQLVLYRLAYHLKPANVPEEIDSPARLVLAIVLTYGLYLRVSGTFHVAVGLLRLFGYSLPETHRKYFLASSLTDFWRRINIYWKDFMVKTVFFPVFFRMRKSGELRAHVVGTLLVFVVTWALHAYQTFWLAGGLHLTVPDALFWALLGVLVTVNVVIEQKRPRGAPEPRGLGLVLRTTGTYVFLAVLWYLWQQPTLGRFWDLVTWWS